MFERTITFCRRMLGVEPSDHEFHFAQEERRQNERFPSDEVVTYSATLPSGAKKSEQAASVRNVSTGGIGLVVPEQLKHGELLSIQLPGKQNAAPVTVLACVVHCRPIDKRTHSIGCTFARELTEEDLACFGASVASRHEKEEQRSRPRTMVELAAGYEVIDDDANEVCPAKVLNISTTGVGLSIGEPLPVGTLINLSLHHVEDHQAKNLLCCVVHASSADDGEYTIGCNFINELAESEFKSLIHRQ